MSKLEESIAMPGSWKEKFKDSAFKTNFQLYLSHSMVEYLCACSENVKWDRARYVSIHRPDNWIACEVALIRRGLVERKCPSEIQAELDAARKQSGGECEYWRVSSCRLTPAGSALVELFKVTGVFVESDNVDETRAAN